MSAIFGVTKENWGAKYLGLNFIEPQHGESLIVTKWVRDVQQNNYGRDRFPTLTQYLIDSKTKQVIGYFSVDGDSYNRPYDDSPWQSSSNAKLPVRDMSLTDVSRELALFYSKAASEENTSASEALKIVSQIDSKLIAKGIKLNSLKVSRNDANYGFVNSDCLHLTYIDGSIAINVSVRIGAVFNVSKLAELYSSLEGYYVLPEPSSHGVFGGGRSLVVRDGQNDELTPVIQMHSYQVHREDENPLYVREPIALSEEDLTEYLEGAQTETPQELAKIVFKALAALDGANIHAISRQLETRGSVVRINAFKGDRDIQINIDV